MTSTTRTDTGATLTVRLAAAADAAALRDLALLDSARPLLGPSVLAELDGRPVAALSLADGRAVADPFVRTAGVLSLVRGYAERMAGAVDARPSRPVAEPRPAAAASY